MLLKAKVRVGIETRVIIQEGAPPSPKFVGIHIANHGPGSVNLQSIALRDTSLWKWMFRKQRHAILNYDYNHPNTNHLPKKLEMGEVMDVFTSYNADCFLKNTFNRLGITDTFGRTHWAPRKSVPELQGKWKVDFCQNLS